MDWSSWWDANFPQKDSNKDGPPIRAVKIGGLNYVLVEEKVFKTMTASARIVKKHMDSNTKMYGEIDKLIADSLPTFNSALLMVLSRLKDVCQDSIDRLKSILEQEGFYGDNN